MYESTSDFDNIEQELKIRGFIGMDEMDSMGKCHKNEKHYILRTDGLIIYTNWPWTHDVYRLDKELGELKKKEPQLYYKSWGMEEFNFKELDEIIYIVDL